MPLTDEAFICTPLAAVEVSLTNEDPPFAVTVSEGVFTDRGIEQPVPTDPLVDDNVTADAVRLPLPVISLPADSEINPMVPVPATTFPATLIAALAAVNPKLLPLPADESYNDTVPLLVSVMLTLPVDVAVTDEAVVVVTVVPPDPEWVTIVGLLNEAAVTVPEPPGVADSVIDVPALSADPRLMSPPVEDSETFGAEIFESPVEVMVAEETMFTCPFALCPVTASPRDTVPFCAVNVTLLAATWLPARVWMPALLAVTE